MRLKTLKTKIQKNPKKTSKTSKTLKTKTLKKGGGWERLFFSKRKISERKLARLIKEKEKANIKAELATNKFNSFVVEYNSGLRNRMINTGENMNNTTNKITNTKKTMKKLRKKR